jgi:biopolymer transport protein ExbB
MDMTLTEVITLGGFAMYTIIASSILAIAVGLERLVAVWSFAQRARQLKDTVVRCLQRGAIAEARTACERSTSPLADVYLIGFEHAGRGDVKKLENAVDRERQRVGITLKNRLWILGTIGATAPFVGLYGTVVGIMRAFSSISTMGNVSLQVVGKPIAEALITTAAGIFVAVEAVVLFNFFNAHNARLVTELKLDVEEFVDALPGDLSGLGGDKADKRGADKKLAAKPAADDKGEA